MYDQIIARSPSIIFRPGGVTAGLVVTTWAQVQQFIALRQGNVIVYIDDSLAAAHVPAASGITDCQSRVELRPFHQNNNLEVNLIIDNGATLKALYKMTGTVALTCNTTGATPALDFDYSGGAAPTLYVEDGASITAAGTQPSCIIPAASSLAIGLSESASIFGGVAPLFQIPGGSSVEIFSTNSIVGNGVAAGAGNLALLFDTASVTLQGGTTPTQPGIAGTYSGELLDPNAIIYKPGIAASFGRVVKTWPEVQAFISNLQGTGIVYVDDSIVSPALVPGATGVTDCQGRVTLFPFKADSVLFTVLQIEPGATLQDLYKVAGMELRCNPQNATNSLSFTSPNGGFMFITDGGMISNAATATFPAINVPNGKIVSFDFAVDSLFQLNAPAVPFFHTVAGAIVNIFAFDASILVANMVDGAGTQLNLFYDNSSANAFPTPGTPPPQPGFTGMYNATNTDNIWAQKPIDATTFNAPNVNDVPHFDGTKWVAGPALLTGAELGVIYQPGGVSAGYVKATWAEVQAVITAASGICIVYVDDSITSPAPVPGATGITDCKGRVELRTAKMDSLGSAVLLIQNGATLRDLAIIRGVEVQCDTRGATPALDFTSVDGGNLLIKDFGTLSNAATATNPAIVIGAALTFFLNMEEGALILNAPAVPLFSVAAAATLQMWALDATSLSAANPGFASGAGNVELNYDNASATFFGLAGDPTPPALPGIAGTYTKNNVDDVWATKALDTTTFNTPLDAQIPIFDNATGKWRSISLSGGATVDHDGVVTVGGAALTGNVNGPSNANRFLSLVQVGNDANVNVVDTSGWYFVRMTALTANRTVTLPAAPTTGMVVVVKDGDGSLANFTITINGNGNTIDGAATYVMTGVQNLPKGAVSLQYDGSAPTPGWFLF